MSNKMRVKESELFIGFLLGLIIIGSGIIVLSPEVYALPSCIAPGFTCPGQGVCPPGGGSCVYECPFEESCSSLGYSCGTWLDECGGSINCGSCPSGEVCDATGQCVTKLINLPCSSQDQIILRLSSFKIDSHGEVFDGSGNYPMEVCYDRIFGSTGGGDRTCAGNAKILGLSSTTDAHAEDQYQTNYPIEICYSDIISCNVRTNNCGIDDPNEKFIVSLTNNTDAHLSMLRGGSNPVIICCSNSGVCGDGILDAAEECDDGNNIDGDGCSASCRTEVSPPPSCSLTAAYWNAPVVGGLFEVTEGTSVGLVVDGTGCDGEVISFEVWEDDFPVNELRNSNPPANVIFSGTSVTGTWVAEWFDDGLFEGNPEYFFKVFANPAGVNINSGTSNAEELHVSETIVSNCSGIVICGDYPSQGECNLDGCSVSTNSVPNYISCADPNIDCSCSWDAAANPPVCTSTWSVAGSSCGDGVINPGETCDGSTWGPINGCGDFDNFSGGNLNCGADCRFDTSSCIGVPGICGDGVINPGETCDGGTWGPINGCGDFDQFSSGSLNCRVDCRFDTSGCSGGPGDNGGTNKIGTCAYNEQTGDNCDDGFLTFSWTAVWTWEPGKGPADDPKNLAGQCVDGSRTIECPAQIPLPFFGAYNFMVALAIIALIYILWASNPGKKSRKK